MGSANGAVSTQFGTPFDYRRVTLADRRPVRYLGGVVDKPLILQVLDWADKFTNEQLREVLDFLTQEYKTRLKEAAHRAALLLRPGDWAENTHEGRKLPAGARGHITEIRRDKIDVHFPDHGCFTMPATMVRKVDPPQRSVPE
jgi:hypothetical protein